MFSTYRHGYFITLETRMVQSISQEKSRCNDHEDYDPNKALEECVYAAFTKEEGYCSPPWMGESDRNCESYEELKQLKSVIKSPECRAVHACTKWNYRVIEQHTDEQLPYRFRMKMLVDQGVHALIQTNTFSLIQLVADIGAIIAVVWPLSFLGLTLAQINEHLKALYKYVKKDFIEMLVTTIFFTVFFVEVGRLIAKFASAKSAMSIDIESSASVTLPSVTFCYKETYNISFRSQTKAYQENYYEELFLHPFNDLTTCVYAGQDCLQRKGAHYRWKTEYHRSIVCSTIELHKTGVNASFLSVSFLNRHNDNDYLCTYLHELDHVPRYFEWKYCHLIAKKRTSNIIRFSTRVIDRFSFCSNNYVQCLESCWVQKFLSGKPTCDLPKKTSQGLSHCKYFRWFEKMARESSALYGVISTCDCSQPCYEKQFHITHVLSPKQGNRLSIQIDFTPLQQEIEKEKWEYTFSELLAETGGLMNLFTGMALLTIFVWIKDIVQKMLSKRGYTYVVIIRYVSWIFTGAAYVFVVYEIFLGVITYSKGETDSAAAFPGFYVREYPAKSECFTSQLWEYDEEELFIYDIANGKRQKAVHNSSQEIESFLQKMYTDLNTTILEMYNTGSKCKYYGRKCKDLVNEKRLIPSLHIGASYYCLTLRWNDSFNNMYLNNGIEFLPEKNSKVYMHPGNESITAFYQRFEGNNGIVIYNSLNNVMQISVKKYILLNCEEATGYSKMKCLDACIHSVIEHRLQCRLPWNEVSNFGNFCYKPLDYKYATDTINSVTSEDLKKCNCPQECSKTKYDLKHLATGFSRNLKPLTLYVLDDLTVINISSRHTFAGMVTGMSGILALFTGLTFYQMFQLLYKSARKLSKMPGFIITRAINLAR